jgi:DNA-binding HxlR family transcriptional regulator
MERDGLIVRKVYPTVPPKVEYTLTTEGLTLVDLVDRVHAWAVAHTDVVLRAQRRFDEVSGAAIDKNADASLPSGRKTNRP